MKTTHRDPPGTAGTATPAPGAQGGALHGAHGMPELLAPLLAQVSALHDHLCPRQVMGVRMGLLGGEFLGVTVPQMDKRLFAFVETDGCGADGFSVATGCWVGRRTLRVEDYGKMAATLVDTATGRAVRVWPNARSRTRAGGCDGTPDERWHAMLDSYQTMPADELLSWAPVRLAVDLERIISSPGRRVVCDQCGEEIMNEREVVTERGTFCRACCGGAYYRI